MYHKKRLGLQCDNKYALPLFLIYSFDNDDMKSSKRNVTLPTLIFQLKYFAVKIKKKLATR